MPTLDQLASRYHVLESTDATPFQRRARILQSLWRQQKRLPVGSVTTPRGGQRPLGSLLPMPDAQTHLHNFLSETTQSVVRDEVLNYAASKGKLYKRPRLFNDLLSTQALTFNLFAELQRNLPLATSTFRSLFPARIDTVTAIQFEHSPLRPTGDKSAFDLFLQYTTPTSTKGFVGLTIKYHETLLTPPSPHRETHDQTASQMNCFKPTSLPHLRQSPLHHLWLPHLLAGSTQLTHSYSDSISLFLYPEQNPHLQSAATNYANALTSSDTFSSLTLESLTRQIRPHTKDPWLDRFQDRYLNFPKIDALLAKS